MSLEHLFSFSARNTRLQWWIIQITTQLIALFMFFLVSVTHITGAFIFFMFIVAVLLVYVSIGNTINRLRDAGYRPATYFLTFIPFAGPIVLIVICGVLPTDFNQR